MALLSRAIGPSVSRRMRLIPEFDYGWEWVLPASREALWPLVSDTNRFNRDTGMPTLAVAEAPRAAAASGRRRLRAARLGLGLEWEEEPFEWIRPQRFAVVRRYLRGPVAEVSVRVELAAEGDAATRLRYEVRAKARTALGLLAIPLQIGVLSARRFRAVFYRYAELAAAQERAGLQLPPAARARLAPGGRERLASLRAKLIERTDQPELVARLVDLVECGDDVVLARLRPYALADAWRAPRRALLELCLHASRIGLLDLQWDLICPHCRGAQQTAGTLGDLECDCHCTACNVDFAANFEQSVELTFRPNPAVRPVVAYAFCVGGPQVTPHIVVQQRLDPGEVRMLRPALEAGRYRLR
ncbi:MAG: hypothetical protein HY703_02055, partial [Gemmatimonadetes bacterium]|nr:hypothetical protein [Gemmatimonadota bacterium]